MKPEIKQKWVTALRSGNYKQGYFKLKTNDCFCVIGVLCDILKNELNANWNSYDVFTIGDFSSDTSLSPSFLLYCGFTSFNDLVLDLGSENYISLLHLNDVHKFPFSKLADLIETQL